MHSPEKERAECNSSHSTVIRIEEIDIFVVNRVEGSGT